MEYGIYIKSINILIHRSVNPHQISFSPMVGIWHLRNLARNIFFMLQYKRYNNISANEAVINWRLNGWESTASYVKKPYIIIFFLWEFYDEKMKEFYINQQMLYRMDVAIRPSNWVFYFNDYLYRGKPSVTFLCGDVHS